MGGLTPAFFLLVCCPQEATTWKPEIPRVWDEDALPSIELPLPHAEFSPVHVPGDYYYAIPVRPIYKSYPVYHPDHEPEGYWASRFVITNCSR